ncbi:hypothetical protein [Variovorax sp.]|uniref:hypothetical protein n=1 Tax=Variovorax sp. TaxID=1871043 RepID=UPI002D794527|nr:hypothetical protein [Variovorax sp.]
MIRPNSPRFRILIAALFSGLLCSCRDAPLPPRIEKAATDVKGFDLVFDGSAAPTAFGLFEVGYAIKANYGYFTYRGKLYSSVGGGSALIRPVTSSPAAFTVRETAQATDEHGNATKSLLQILDKNNGQELARRVLVAHAVEDGTGWTGDHAVKFVREVLKSPQAPGRPWGVADYRPTVAQIQLSEPLTSSPYPRQVEPEHCPETLRIERRRHSSTIRGEGFEFLPYHPLNLVACDSGRVLVTSGVYASDFYFDALTLDGEHISQGHVRLPLPLEARWAALKEVSLDGRTVRATLLVNQQADFKSAVSAHRLVQIQALLE